MNDHAVFYYNDCGDLEQLSIWIDRESAIIYLLDKNYFGNYNKIVLMKVSCNDDH